MTNNKEIISELNAKTWTKNKQEILEATLKFLNGNTKLTYLQYPELFKYIKLSKSTPNKAERIVIRDVFNQMNEHAGYEIDLPKESLKIPRPSLLPVVSEQYNKIKPIYDLSRSIRKIKVSSCSYESPFLLILSSTLITESMTSQHVLMWILGNLTWKNIDLHTNRIVMSFDEEEPAPYILPLSTFSVDLLKKYKRLTQPKNINSFVFIPEKSAASIKLPIKKLVYRRKIIQKEFNKQLENFHSEENIKLTWQNFTSLAVLIPILKKGIEPFILTVASNFPLPTPYQPFESLPLLYSDMAIFTYACSSVNLVSLPNELKKNIAEKNNEKSYSYSPTLWLSESRRIIRKLIRQLKAITSDNITRQKDIKVAHNIIDELLINANSIAPPSSALHLALLWVKHLIKKDKPGNNPKASSIATWTYSVFTSKLLMYEESIDLNNWLDEEHELLIAEYFESNNLSKKTKTNLAGVLRRVYKFAQNNQFVEEINICFLYEEFLGGNNRNFIIAPAEFKKFCDWLIKIKINNCEAIVVACIFAYWAGLRRFLSSNASTPPSSWASL